MSTTPSSSAQVTFYGPPESVEIAARSASSTSWLALSHEVFQDRGEDDDGNRLLPARIEVEAVMFGSPEELHAFALRMVAAVEAEWPETAPTMAEIIGIDPGVLPSFGGES